MIGLAFLRHKLKHPSVAFLKSVSIFGGHNLALLEAKQNRQNMRPRKSVSNSVTKQAIIEHIF